MSDDEDACPLTICVVGSLNLDRTFTLPALPHPGATVHAQGWFRSAGGKGANQAVAAALLGGRVQLIGAVGDDAAGALVLEEVRARGVDVSAVATTDQSTGEATILVDAAGENMIVVSGGANLALRSEFVERADGAAGIVVTGFEVDDEVVVAAARHADLAEALLVLNPSPVRPLRTEMFARRTLLIVNEHELAALAPAASAAKEHLARVSSAYGDCDLVVTRGGDGAAVYDAAARRYASIPPIRVAAVDTSGCGDAFTGALVEALSRRMSLIAAAEQASAVGAFAATRRGTQTSYPSKSELRDWLRAAG